MSQEENAGRVSIPLQRELESVDVPQPCDESIFEVCDTTNDEYCFPIGYFGTLERAKKEIKDKMLNGFSISQHTDDYEKIEVFELSIGWGDVRKSVFCIEREKTLDETKDEFVWKTISV